jgi:hypothetical protein
MLVECRDCGNEYDDRQYRRCPGCGSYLSDPVPVDPPDTSEAELFDRNEADAINRDRVPKW